MTPVLKYGEFHYNINEPISDVFTVGKIISSGSDGKVSDIIISKGKSNFEPKVGNRFAMKVIAAGKAGDKERAALEFFHPKSKLELTSITKSYTGFRFNKQYHIISERASTTLSTLLEGERKGALDETWLRQQSKALARALVTIHGIRGKKIGMHHDIKPQNILVFSNQSYQLKLTDWGHSAVNQDPNFRQSAAPNAAYGPPEMAPSSSDSAEQMIQQTARPHDIWTLGCVFLQLLIWFLQGAEALKDFRKQNKTENPNGAYWRRENRNVVVSREVERKMAELKGAHGAWATFVDAVQRMLEPRENARITAGELAVLL